MPPPFLRVSEASSSRRDGFADGPALLVGFVTWCGRVHGVCCTATVTLHYDGDIFALPHAAGFCVHVGLWRRMSARGDLLQF
jgi:hypothetical protein